MSVATSGTVSSLVTSQRATGGIRAITPAAVLRHPRGRIGLALMFLVVGAAVISLFWTPYPPTQLHLKEVSTSAGGHFLLGSDQFGRDILSRLMVGARASLIISLGAAAGALVVGLIIGVVAGYCGGVIDLLVTRIIDIMLAIPGLILAIGIVAILGSSAASVSIALALVYLWQFARIFRSGVVSLRDRTYVEASRGLGAKSAALIVRDILPGLVPLLVVQTSTAIAWAVLDEASLGFLGLGVQPPAPSLGSMLTDGRTHLYDTPLLSVTAGAAVLITILGFNLLGDALQDILDPRSA